MWIIIEFLRFQMYPDWSRDNKASLNRMLNNLFACVQQSSQPQNHIFIVIFILFFGNFNFKNKNIVLRS